ncbi:TVP38/TMEM64 family protein [Streptomyces antimicrobicus]|uniref:TVP38/TMEM64 family membrane protein n=1 Tax=Streptomyces antimicrobicus TaxID=2883108 RepID=A0ABS8BET9_9ACTN|nr:VTT domain-containing protein [Streptomyces antimicrobicus]MCB5183152.1 VTT domain-containing protein [Streptomyces antimicrobicus]
MSLLLAPWIRLALLVVLLAAAGVGVWWYEPQRLLSQGWAPGLPPGLGVLLFAAGYGLCTAAFVPRPLLNLGAGAVLGAQWGLLAAVAGTVLGAGISFGLGRVMGQQALRPLLRGRWLRAADGQLSRHGFRSVLAVRIFPGVPFAVANYCAAVSRCGWLPFLLATAIGTVPNTAAYVVAGGTASSPTSPAFLLSLGFLTVSGLLAGVVGWRKRHRVTGAPDAGPAPVAVEATPVVGAGSHGP